MRTTLHAPVSSTLLKIAAVTDLNGRKKDTFYFHLQKTFLRSGSFLQNVAHTLQFFLALLFCLNIGFPKKLFLCSLLSCGGKWILEQMIIDLASRPAFEANSAFQAAI